MNAESIFLITTFIAFIGWFLLLFVSPFWYRADRFIIGIIIALLAIIYIWLAVEGFDIELAGNFNSLSDFIHIFSVKTLAAAAWVHYLAIDLLAGTWIKKNSFRHGINHWLVILCLLLTLCFGPLGVLVYLIVRATKAKQYFAENF